MVSTGSTDEKGSTDGGTLTVRALSPETWDAFADLVERHNGVFGGCWCTYFQTMHDEKTFDAGSNRELKERLVREGRAHAALVFDGDVAVGWAEFGSCAELPNIYHRKQYDRRPTATPTTGSPASSSTSGTVAAASPASPCGARST